MKPFHILFIVLVCSASLLLVGASPGDATVKIAQISDTHLGEKHSPAAAENLREAVKMINARHPDAVILSGDIGENAKYREEVKTILKGLDAPIYYVPGNHDIRNTNDLAHYRKQFGPDYYRFQVKYVEVLALDSQLLGNYATWKNWKALPPLPPAMEAESKKMLDWLADQPKTGKVVISVQHVPLFNDNGFPETNPYWIVDTNYTQRESNLLRKFGVKDLLAGHWHIYRVFKHDGFTIHVAPATSWLPFGGKLGFAMHTISASGEVHTEFVPLPNATP